MDTQFCTKKSLCKATGLSNSTFKKYRFEGDWIEGIHWQRVNSRCVLYNLSLILDWLANRSQPEHHQKAIDFYVRSLPSNQGRRRSAGV